MLGLIVTLVIVGLIAGALARLLVPGTDPIGFGGTVLLGIVGSFIGGFLGYVLFHKDKATASSSRRASSARSSAPSSRC